MTNDEVLRRGVVDYTQSSSLAELACRWAEQRRRAVEVRYSHLLQRRLSCVTVRQSNPTIGLQPLTSYTLSFAKINVYRYDLYDGLDSKSLQFFRPKIEQLWLLILNFKPLSFHH